LFALVHTLFDIIRLRKGPDAIPHSSLLFAMAIALWLFASVAVIATSAEPDLRDFLFGVVTAAAGLLCYVAIVLFAGRAPRLLQTVTAIIGCGALLSVLYVAVDVFLAPFLGENLTGLVAMLILFWSVPVEGHIIARAIDRHWYVGIVAAMAVFVLQLFLYSIIDPLPVAAS
jgi:hypothetical protein